MNQIIFNSFELKKKKKIYHLKIKDKIIILIIYLKEYIGITPLEWIGERIQILKIRR